MVFSNAQVIAINPNGVLFPMYDVVSGKRYRVHNRYKNAFIAVSIVNLKGKIP